MRPIAVRILPLNLEPFIRLNGHVSGQTWITVFDDHCFVGNTADSERWGHLSGFRWLRSLFGEYGYRNGQNRRIRPFWPHK